MSVLIRTEGEACAWAERFTHELEKAGVDFEIDIEYPRAGG